MRESVEKTGTNESGNSDVFPPVVSSEILQENFPAQASDLVDVRRVLIIRDQKLAIPVVQTCEGSLEHDLPEVNKVEAFLRFLP